MQTVETIKSLRGVVRGWRAAGERIAFVPTMGNLHRGHMTLVQAAASDADRVVVSIFVNPTQFGAGEDFDSYPRTLESDARQLRQIGADLLFAPAVDEVYPEPNRTVVEVKGVSEDLCGAFRPGHFTGVATVVCKLLNMVQPDAAFFGEKDFQQLAVIRSMVDDLNMPVSIQGVATVREPDGLAMSSRNGYLTRAERGVAPALYRTLCEARDVIRAGARRYQDVQERQTERLKAAGFSPEYFAVRRAADLAPPEPGDRDLVILAAARLGKARLIDNVRVMLSNE